MLIDVAVIGANGDLSLDTEVKPATEEHKAAEILLSAGWEYVSCSKDNGVHITFRKSEEQDVEQG